MSKFVKIKMFIWLLLYCTLLCTACKKEEDVFLKESSQELKEEISEKTQEETENTEEIDSSKEMTEQEKQTDIEEVCVYVCGAVENPGIYALDNGKRIGDAIEMAGGMNESAAQDYLNQAEILSDGQMIKVLTLEEQEVEKEEKEEKEVEETNEESGRVNLNTATREQLMTLPGIGQNKAESIITYREENGALGSIEDVMNITGIKEGVFNKIKEDISVD